MSDLHLWNLFLRIKKWLMLQVETSLISGIAPLDDDFHLAAWREGQIMHWIRLDGLPWHQGKGHALGQSRQQQLSLHQRKVIADADAWPCSKGKVGVAWQLLFSFGREAFGIK